MKYYKALFAPYPRRHSSKYCERRVSKERGKGDEINTEFIIMPIELTYICVAFVVVIDLLLYRIRSWVRSNNNKASNNNNFDWQLFSITIIIIKSDDGTVCFTLMCVDSIFFLFRSDAEFQPVRLVSVNITIKIGSSINNATCSRARAMRLMFTHDVLRS